MKNYISWSGGKDSTATIILCYEEGIHIDGVIMSEVMFSHEKQISGESPEHIKFIYETAIPIIQYKFNFNVIMLRDKEDYLSLFNHRLEKSSVPERIGKKAGWLIGGRCAANSRLKMRPLRTYFKEQGEHYPELWGELELLAEDKEIASDSFKYGRSFKSVNREVQILKNQISIFD